MILSKEEMNKLIADKEFVISPLLEIDQMVKFSELHRLPPQKELMVEGLHYYYENGFLVFTELYHLQRGFCCKNKCRHCAYGNKK